MSPPAALAQTPQEILAVDFATLAREIAQDIFSVEQIVALHRLSADEWLQIQQHPRFVRMLAEMQREWNSAANTRERVRIKAQTGLESQLEVFINEIAAENIPLSQKVEAGKFLARLGEMDGSKIDDGKGGGFAITINIGDVTRHIEVPVEVARIIEHDSLTGDRD